MRIQISLFPHQVKCTVIKIFNFLRNVFQGPPGEIEKFFSICFEIPSICTLMLCRKKPDKWYQPISGEILTCFFKLKIILTQNLTKLEYFEFPKENLTNPKPKLLNYFTVITLILGIKSDKFGHLCLWNDLFMSNCHIPTGCFKKRLNSPVK